MRDGLMQVPHAIGFAHQPAQGIRAMKHRCLSLLLLFVPLAHAETALDAPEGWGETVPAQQALPLDQALAGFDANVIEPRVYQGRIVEVCEKRGCWAMLELDGHSARVMPRDYGFMMPRDLRGEALVYGVLLPATAPGGSHAPEHGHDHAHEGDHGHDHSHGVTAEGFRIDALGVVMVE